MQNRHYLILPLALVLALNISCQKNRKAPRPLDVTQKILTDRAGEYQNINGFSFKFGSDKKLTLTKKFISITLTNQTSPTLPTGAEPKDVYCLNSRELNITQVKELSFAGVSELYPYYNLTTQLDQNKPVYVFEADDLKNMSTIYEDVNYSAVSKIDSRMARHCQSEDSESETAGSPFIAQYTDDNTAIFFSMYKSDASVKFETAAKFYKSLDDSAFSSDEFVRNFPSIDRKELSMRLGYNNRSGNLQYSKESRAVTIHVPTVAANIGIPELCGFHIVIESSRMYKKNLNSFPLMVLKSRFFPFVQSATYNFIDPRSVRIELSDPGPHSSACNNELIELKKMESAPSDFLFGFQHYSGQGTFFIYSPKSASMNFQASYSTWENQ